MGALSAFGRICLRWVFLLGMLFPAMSFAEVTAILQWDPPTTNADGTPLLDLAGYRVYMAFAPIPEDKAGAQMEVEVLQGTETATIDVELPTVGAVVYFRATAFDTSGNESALSNEVSKDFLAPVTIIIRFLPDGTPIIRFPPDGTPIIRFPPDGTPLQRRLLGLPPAPGR